MADAIARSALADHLVPGRFGLEEGPPGVTLEESATAAMAQVAGVADGAALRDALSVHALDGEPGALRCCEGDTLRLLWNGPGQYLAVSREHREEDLALSLATALSELGGVAVDLSHARTVMRLTGPACIEVLAKGCPLDVEAMATGGCAPTLLGHFNVLLHRRDERDFEIYVTRSYAVACFEWLRRAGEEFGIQVR